MKQITVRGVTEELGRRLVETAEAKGMSLNATVLDLLGEAVGLSNRRAWLDRFTDWSPEEVEELNESVRVQRGIDAKLWR
ncbi:MAG: hypothetical protein HYV07_31570 [Deltaproteobacteria bacterium]|nr:hypothetical protein [Deltaproteobacteria bacterium]